MHLKCAFITTFFCLSTIKAYNCFHIGTWHFRTNCILGHKPWPLTYIWLWNKTSLLPFEGRSLLSWESQAQVSTAALSHYGSGPGRTEGTRSPCLLPASFLRPEACSSSVFCPFLVFSSSPQGCSLQTLKTLRNALTAHLQNEQDKGKVFWEISARLAETHIFIVRSVSLWKGNRLLHPFP